MAEERVQTALRKKAEAGKPVADGAPMTAARAIGQVLAKVAQDMLGLALQVNDIRETRMSLADLPEALEDLSLLAMIEGPAEGLGLVALPPSTLSALIEVQTMGQLAKNAPAPRKPTRIDASMAADFIDAVLMGIEELLAETEAAIWAGGFRYASYLDDPRPLGLLLEDIGYRVWQIQLGMGPGGARTGAFFWAVPANGRGARRSPPASDAVAPTANAPPSTAEAEAWGAQMEHTVLGTQVTLEAVLHRVTLPLSAVMGLKPGMQIPVPSEALEQLRLEGAGRRQLSFGHLGQHRGFRAVRLRDDSAEAAEGEPTRKPRGAASKFDAGTSPFARPGAPPAAHIGDLGNPDAPAYDPAEGAHSAVGGFGAMKMGDLDAASGGDGPLPMGMALDGFGATDEDEPGGVPALKIGSGL